MLASLSRIFAMLLLPLSIAPVLLLGPSMLRAPVALGHEAWGDMQRLEAALRPAHRRPPAQPLRLGPSTWRPVVSLGTVYGRWSTFPQPGVVGFQRDAGNRVATTTTTTTPTTPAATVRTTAGSPAR